MKLLVIGGGGREHALAWKLAQSAARAEGLRRARQRRHRAENGARRTSPITRRSPSWSTFAQKRERSHLTVVGPEAPLAAGIVDAFRAAGLRDLRPDAARRRSSRPRRTSPRRSWRATASRPRAIATFTERRARRTPTSTRAARRSWSRPTGSPRARAWSSRRRATEAHAAIDAMLVADALGDAGARVVIEDFLEGEEASFIVMVDGTNVLPLASSQDHKRLLDGDQGPNTGGMGAYSPAPVVTPEVHARVMREIIQPAVQGMAAGRHAVHRLPLRRPDDRRRPATRRRSNSTAAWATRRRSRSCCG